MEIQRVYIIRNTYIYTIVCTRIYIHIGKEIYRDRSLCLCILCNNSAVGILRKKGLEKMDTYLKRKDDLVMNSFKIDIS